MPSTYPYGTHTVMSPDLELGETFLLSPTSTRIEVHKSVLSSIDSTSLHPDFFRVSMGLFSGHQ